MEDSLNLGVGMVAVVSAAVASEVAGAINEAGVDAWTLGCVASRMPDGEIVGCGGAGGAEGARLILGTKGVKAGAVLLHGSYRVG